MSSDLELILPWPPTVNSYYSVVGHQRGIRRISQRGRQFREEVVAACLEQLGDFEALTHRIYCEIILFPPDRRQRDLDNYMKSLLDAITHSQVWEDDSLIDQLVIHRGVLIPKGSVHLTITEAGPLRRHNTTI